MIVEATLPLLIEHGEMVTTRQIADAAGIAEGTIFRVFADKDELIAAVLDTALDTAALEHALAGVDASLAFEDRLTASVEILQRRTVDIWRLVSSIGTKFHDGARRPMTDLNALVVLFEQHRDRLTVEPSVAARLLRAFTLSLTHPAMIDEPMSPAEIVTFFMQGTAKEQQC
jgi:AcrR family transcriptional regulator